MEKILTKGNGAIQQAVKLLRSCSLSGLFRYLFLKVRGKSVLVTGSCRGCGSCCNNLSLEGRTGWLRDEKEFRRIAAHHPEYARFEITGTDSQGFLLFHCSWRTSKGSCRDYDNRLPLCRKFPESSLAFAGGRLPDRCGYRFSEGVAFAKILKQELNKSR